MSAPNNAPAHTATPGNPGSQRAIRFKIKRQDSPQQAPYWDEFDVPYRPKLNVISCLQWIAEHPVTVQGRKVAPVVWDCNCLEEVCGACTMVINGTVRQSCSALIDPMLNPNGQTVITLEPMSKFPVVRDLWVDRSRMFGNLVRIKAWVPIDGTHNAGLGPRETPEQQDMRYNLSRCMTCGCCLEACPQFLADNAFVGAQVFAQVDYFNRHQTGAVTKDQRLEVMEEPGGIADCGNAQNCVRICPKELPLAEAIAAIGRQTTVHAIKKFFGGK